MDRSPDATERPRYCFGPVVSNRAGGRQLRELLVAAARPHSDDRRIAALVASIDIDEMVAAARHHKVLSLLHERLLQIDGISRKALDALAIPRLVAQAHRFHLQRTLARATEALDVPALTIKGHVLATNWYENPATRDFGDVDLVVKARDFEQAVDSLAAAGIEPVTSNWHGFLDHEVAEVPVRFETSVVDLHWHVVATGEARRHLHLPTAEFFERAEPVRRRRTRTAHDVPGRHTCPSLRQHGPRWWPAPAWTDRHRHRAAERPYRRCRVHRTCPSHGHRAALRRRAAAGQHRAGAGHCRRVCSPNCRPVARG